MPKRSSKKRPRDANQLAKFVVDALTSDEPVVEETTDETPETTKDGKNAAAVALGRLGGKKGGPARAAKLTAKQRSDIARRAAQARWRKSTDSQESPP